MKKTHKHHDGRYRLGLKLSLLTLIIISSADVLSFTATLVIGAVTDGTNDTLGVLGSVIASIVIGVLMSFVIGNTVLHPLWELVKATKRVAAGDYTAEIKMGFSEKHTIRELSQLIKNFNGMSTELRNTELFRKDFISNFSHEFKTPLASIRGFARQLYEGELSAEQQKEFAKIILDETEYLSDLSANIMLLTSLENKDIVSEKTTFNLDEQLRSCMLHLEPLWSEKDIEIDMEQMEEISIHWNEQILAHVWNNLFDNAVKFTPVGGTIRVTCRRQNDLVTVTVSDSGIGISPEALPHIFDKFYQEDSSHATKGCGLGLSLVKRIVEMCGGTVEVTSSPEAGTTFTITLKFA